MQRLHKRYIVYTCFVLSVLFTCMLACTEDEKDNTQGNNNSSNAGGMTSGIAAGSIAGTTAGMNAGNTAGTANASCTSNDDCSSPQACHPESNMCQVTCSTSEECVGDTLCLESFCQSAPRCDDSTPCPASLTCDCNNVCVTQVGAMCTTPLQCSTQEYCSMCEKQCKPKVAPCEPCTESDSCERSADLCTSLNNESVCLRACTGQGTCDNLGPGYTCEALSETDSTTYCKPTAGSCATLTGCGADQDCPVGEYCNDRQQCQPGCIDDTACAGGLLCQGLRCEPPCSTNGDCQEGAECQMDGYCKIPGGCQSSRDCLEAETYCDLSLLMCLAGCQVDDDCLDATQVCQNGSCTRRGCEFNYQCSFGEVCDVPSATCVMAEGRHCEINCDPMASDTSCGDGGQRCLSLQDEDENPLGDFCFEPCQEEPNTCPQGYTCTVIPDPNDMQNELSLCFRNCSNTPNN
jgi:hypothetical protein